MSRSRSGALARPSNNEMKRTSHGPNGGSPLISVFSGRMRATLLSVAALIAGVPIAAGGHRLTPLHERIIARWLAGNPGHRIATLEDCACDADVKYLRTGDSEWPATPDYHPYRATGDFNADGHRDFALVTRTTSDPPKWMLVVFNGPLGEQARPAFVERRLDFGQVALFYGPPRPKPYRLLIGGFESHGVLMEPKGKSYEINWSQ